MKTYILILSALITFVFSSCERSSGSDHVVLNAEKFEQKLNGSSDKIILDVRTPEEFANGHIPGAVLINILDPDFEKKVNELDKSRPVFVYCAKGVRSEKAAGILTRSGFNEVYHLENGLNAWNNAQKELTK